MENKCQKIEGLTSAHNVLIVGNCWLIDEKNPCYHLVVWIFCFNKINTTVMEDVKWICTDPDCNQYGRKIGERTYEFKQDWNYGGKIVLEQDEIDLNDYTDDEINDHLSPYGWSIEQLKEENTLEDAEWLMAECIFEQTAGGH